MLGHKGFIGLNALPMRAAYFPVADEREGEVKLIKVLGVRIGKAEAGHGRTHRRLCGGLC